jgi:hypothetical protein
MVLGMMSSPFDNWRRNLAPVVEGADSISTALYAERVLLGFRVDDSVTIWLQQSVSAEGSSGRLR